jgi:hypothetical protein
MTITPSSSEDRFVQPMTLERRVEQLEQLLGTGPFVTSATVDIEERDPVADAAARRSTFAGGLRVIAVPEPEQVIGLPHQPRRLLIAGGPGGQMIELRAGSRFEPGLLADSIEQLALERPGLIVERIAVEEG